jgi:CubicO group peptidase (beta-lactamase class C family)
VAWNRKLVPIGVMLCLAFPAIAAELDAEAQQLLEAGAAGFSMALVDKNGIYWSESYGFADIDAKRPMSIDAIMNVASISKTVTGVSLMLLVEQGKLDLDRDVNDYLPFKVENPHFPGEVITARQLLTHTSSIVDRDELYNSEVVYFPGGDNPISLGEFVREYLSSSGEFFDPANFAAYPPGAERQYSNAAYGLAGYLVEVLSGQPLNRYSRDKIFGPLNMRSTGWMLTETDTGNHAKLYEWAEDGRAAIDWYGLATWPDGGMRTSVLDLSRFFAAMINNGELEDNRILGKKTVEAMFERQFAQGQVLAAVEDGESHQQAIAWSYRSDRNGGTVVGHSGGDPGVTTHAYFYPASGRGAILLVNTSSDSESFGQAVSVMIRALLRAALEE